MVAHGKGFAISQVHRKSLKGVWSVCLIDFKTSFWLSSEKLLCVARSQSCGDKCRCQYGAGLSHNNNPTPQWLKKSFSHSRYASFMYSVPRRAHSGCRLTRFPPRRAVSCHSKENEIGQMIPQIFTQWSVPGQVSWHLIGKNMWQFPKGWEVQSSHVSTWVKPKCWGTVAHCCNTSYSGGRDQEDHHSRPAQTKSYRDPILINKPGMVVHAYAKGHR
jgi:hypothetical protein